MEKDEILKLIDEKLSTTAKEIKNDRQDISGDKNSSHSDTESVEENKTDIQKEIIDEILKKDYVSKQEMKTIIAESLSKILLATNNNKKSEEKEKPKTDEFII